MSVESGIDDDGIGRGGSYLDFNGDGCLDFYIVNLEGNARLFENSCRWGNNWLAVETARDRRQPRRHRGPHHRDDRRC